MRDFCLYIALRVVTGLDLIPMIEDVAAGMLYPAALVIGVNERVRPRATTHESRQLCA